MTRRNTLLLAAAALVAFASACSGSPPTAAPSPPATTPPSPAPSPTPTLTPSPVPSPPPPAPVRGDVEVVVVDVARAELNVPEDVAVDQAAIDGFVAAVAGALNKHLTALQLGADGMFAGSGLLKGVPPDVRAGVTTTLASPEHLVADVRYNVEVAVAGRPQWAQVEVEVVGDDGRAPTAGFVFVPARGAAKLIATSPGRSS